MRNFVCRNKGRTLSKQGAGMFVPVREEVGGCRRNRRGDELHEVCSLTVSRAIN